MVSVIVPLYNAEEYIERCIFSLTNQTVTDIEILVINDGSTDHSLELAENIAKSDARVRVFTQENKGVSVARNLGIQYAAGEAICFVDADDYVENTYVANMYSAWDEETLVVCNYVQNDSSVKARPCIPNLRLGETRIADFLVGSLGNTIAFSCCNKMFSSKLLGRHNITFPENLKIGEDMMFVLRYLSYAEQIHFVDQGLYHYCIRDSSVMNAKVRNYFADYCDTINALCAAELNGWRVSDETLSLWAMKVLTIIFTNKYFAILSYKKFSESYAFFAQSPLFRYAAMCKKHRNIKTAVLNFVLRIKSKWLLFAIIKLNHLLIP